MKYLLYDTETTSVNTKTCGMHQLSGLVLEYDESRNDFNILDKFNYNVRPFKGKEVTKSALAIGNLTIDILREYPAPEEVFMEFCKLLSKYVDKYNPEDKLIQVGYNVKFDNEVLRQWFIDCGDSYFGSWFWSNCIDVMSDASRVLANVRPYMTNFKLSSVAEMLGAKVQFDMLHDAMEDVYLTFEVLKKCWKSPVPISLDDFDYEIIESQMQQKNTEKNNRA